MTNPVFNSVDRMVRMAYADAGFLQEGSDPSSFQITDAIQRLNDIINFQQTQGLKLWVNQDYAITLIAGIGQYQLTTALGPKPLRIVDAYYSDQNGIRRPLTPMSWAEYIRLSQITQLGQINSYFVDKQINSLNVYLWLVPDTTTALGTVHVVQQQQIVNAITVNDTLSFPTEWFIFLRWALADDIATGQPQAIMDRCALKAAYYKEKLEDWDVEDASTMFQPDQTRSRMTGGFR